MRRDNEQSLAPELLAAFRRCRLALLCAGVFSGLVNMLALSSSIYMLQVYDRVIPSHSVPTLIGLSIAMLILFLGYGILDVVRTRMMSRVGIMIDRDLRNRVLSLVLALPLRASAQADGLQPVRDLDQIRGFMASAAPVALFDLPWLPFYMALVWLLHPWLGVLALGGALVLVGITVLTEMRARSPIKDMASSGAQRQMIAETARRNAVTLRAMGMTGRIARLWTKHNDAFLADQTAATDVVGTYGSVSRVLRLLLQSAVLGLGAYLVIAGQASSGVMIAASILVSRALAPIEIAIANWRGFISARQSAFRLSELLRRVPNISETVQLPAPCQTLAAEGLAVAAPGQQMPIVQNATFTLRASEGLGIVGPSAAGKSTLAKALIGAWQPLRGSVRLDGAALDQWTPDRLGQHIGYLPQDIELLDGTVAENIARFDPDAEDAAVIEAAQQAGVHDMIVHLPRGYDTRIGELGLALSAGQRQRVALARALYGNPFLVVLDEPNSNLDRDGDAALASAIRSVRNRNGIVVVIAHRPSALEGIDKLLVMAAGQPPRFGAKEELLPLVMPASGPRVAQAVPAEAQPGAVATAGAAGSRPAPAARPQPPPQPRAHASGPLPLPAPVPVPLPVPAPAKPQQAPAAALRPGPRQEPTPEERVEPRAEPREPRPQQAQPSGGFRLRIITDD